MKKKIKLPLSVGKCQNLKVGMFSKIVRYQTNIQELTAYKYAYTQNKILTVKKKKKELTAFLYTSNN